MIRFQRIGRTNDPAFRIVVLEKERAAKAGNIVELLGTYNPRSKALTLNEEQVKYWISKGAQPTGSIHNLLITKGVIEGKKINVLPKKKPAAPTSEVGVPTEASGKKEEEVAAPAAAPASETVAETPVVETPVEEELPTEAEVVAEAEPAGEAPVEAEKVEEAPAV